MTIIYRIQHIVRCQHYTPSFLSYFNHVHYSTSPRFCIKQELSVEAKSLKCKILARRKISDSFCCNAESQSSSLIYQHDFVEQLESQEAVFSDRVKHLRGVLSGALKQLKICRSRAAKFDKTAKLDICRRVGYLLNISSNSGSDRNCSVSNLFQEINRTAQLGELERIKVENSQAKNEKHILDVNRNERKKNFFDASVVEEQYQEAIRLENEHEMARFSQKSLNAMKEDSNSTSKSASGVSESLHIIDHCAERYPHVVHSRALLQGRIEKEKNYTDATTETAPLYCAVMARLLEMLAADTRPIEHSLSTVRCALEKYTDRLHKEKVSTISDLVKDTLVSVSGVLRGSARRTLERPHSPFIVVDDNGNLLEAEDERFIGKKKNEYMLELDKMNELDVANLYSDLSNARDEFKRALDTLPSFKELLLVFNFCCDMNVNKLAQVSEEDKVKGIEQQHLSSVAALEMMTVTMKCFRERLYLRNCLMEISNQEQFLRDYFREGFKQGATSSQDTDNFLVTPPILSRILIALSKLQIIEESIIITLLLVDVWQQVEKFSPAELLSILAVMARFDFQNSTALKGANQAWEEPEENTQINMLLDQLVTKASDGKNQFSIDNVTTCTAVLYRRLSKSLRVAIQSHREDKGEIKTSRNQVLLSLNPFFMLEYITNSVGQRQVSVGLIHALCDAIVLQGKRDARRLVLCVGLKNAEKMSKRKIQKIADLPPLQAAVRQALFSVLDCNNAVLVDSHSGAHGAWYPTSHQKTDYFPFYDIVDHSNASPMPRLLLFTAHQLNYACNAVAACEVPLHGNLLRFTRYVMLGLEGGIISMKGIGGHPGRQWSNTDSTRRVPSDEISAVNRRFMRSVFGHSGHYNRYSDNASVPQTPVIVGDNTVDINRLKSELLKSPEGEELLRNLSDEGEFKNNT